MENASTKMSTMPVITIIVVEGPAAATPDTSSTVETKLSSTPFYSKDEVVKMFGRDFHANDIHTIRPLRYSHKCITPKKKRAPKKKWGRGGKATPNERETFIVFCVQETSSRIHNPCSRQ